MSKNSSQNHDNSVQIWFRVGKFGAGYKGDHPGKDAFKFFGTAGAIGLLVYGGVKLINLFFGKKENRDKGAAQASQPSFQTQGPVLESTTPKSEPPKAETLNETIQKSQAQAEDGLLTNIISAGDICFLCGPTGVGKSTLAMQIAIKIASGKVSTLLPDDSPCEPQHVIYYDGENSDDVMKKRYGQSKEPYPDDLKRIINCRFESTEKLLDDFEYRIFNCGKPTTVIVDNMFSLFNSMTGPEAKDFLNRIQSIQNRSTNKVTFIIVNHTTKEFKENSPLLIKHIDGSSSFTNLATSILGIAPSRFPEQVMLKVIKSRNHANDKSVLIEKLNDEDYLHFEYVKTMTESEALPVKAKGTPEPKTEKKAQAEETPFGIHNPNGTKRITPEIEDQIKRLAKNGMNQGEIAKKVGFSRKSVNKVLNRKIVTV